VSQVNLLPPEIRQRAQTRKTTLMVVAAGGAVLVLILFLFFLQSANLDHVNEEVADQEAANAKVQAEINGLQPFAALQADAESKQALLTAVYADELSFSGVLLDLSRVIPTDAYLTTFAATTTPDAAAPTADGTVLIGTLTAGGEASGVETLSSWITRLEQVKGWVNPWITTFTEVAPAGSERFTFNSGVDLTTDALTKRGKEGAEAVAADTGVVAP
jgi:Tfp pilus assembly protein PilN